MFYRRRLILILLLALVTLFPEGVFPVQGGATTSSAALGAPDAPESGPENLNQLSGIRSANPGEGINLIAPPEANASGDAALDYPLDVPAGRDGIEPRLAISYASSAGDGWLGLGWDLALPAISIDTRWGVPRYDGAVETETYMLDGEQLAPIAHRGPPQPRTAEKIFHTRVEDAFERIIRHGNSPASYWWEVVAKDGVRSFYGGSPELGRDPDAVLTDGAGHVFRWALREIRSNENAVLYSYVRVADVGVAGGSVPGYQLYPKYINYSRSNGAPGPYTVTFVRDRELPGWARRPDVTIDARGGFKQVTADLLSRVEITFNGQLVRRYDLSYQEGAFRKTLLASITQRGENGAVFHTHSFSYYRESQSFAAGADWSTGDDNVIAPVVDALAAPLGFDDGKATALSGSVTDGGGGHIYVGFNLSSPTKSNSAGGKVGFNYSQNNGVLELIDLNGDNLPDKVFKDGDGFAYRLNRSGPGGVTVFGPKQALPTLPALSKEHAIMISFGLEAYPGSANFFVNHSDTFTIGSIYFADINADGLPDLVQDGAVLFNHVVNGAPSFTTNSAETPVRIDPGAVDANGIIGDYSQLYQQQLETFPLHDTVRRWIAPYDGRVRIGGSVALIQDTSPARQQYTTADGVRVAIQQNGGELWSTRIGPTDYSPKTPAGLESVAVRKGDRLYFRAQSVFDGAYDQLAWNPEIVYLDDPALSGGAARRDVNGLDVYRFTAGQDFVLAGRRDMHVQMPFNGTVRLTGDLLKSGVTTDDVAVLVLKNGSPVATQSMRWDQTGALPVAQDIAVAKNDLIELRVQADSPIDLRQLDWHPSLFYTATSDKNPDNTPIPVQNQQGQYLIQLHPPYDIDMYPVSDLAAPQDVWTVPQNGTLTVMPQLTAAPDANGRVVVTVKRPGALVAKHAITISSGTVQNSQFTVAVTAGDKLAFDYSVADPQLAAKLGNRSIQVSYDPSTPPATTVPSDFHTVAPAGLFPQPYRGWGYAGYNGNGYETRALDESRLAVRVDDYKNACPRTTDQADSFVNGDFNSSSCNGAKATAYAFAPYPEDGQWRGPAKGGWAAAATISSARLGADHPEVPTADQVAKGRAISRLNITAQTSVGAGISVVSGSDSGNIIPGANFTQLDQIDMNGDGFPDVVGDGRIQYTTPGGGLETSNRTVAGFSDHIRASADSAWNIGLEGNPAQFRSNASGKVQQTAAGSVEGATKGNKGSPRGNGAGSQMVSLGFSGSLGYGDSATTYDLVDVNGDGLPDRVTRDGAQLLVALNLGYGFAAAERWGDSPIDVGASRSFSLGGTLGFNGGDYDFAGGLSLDKNTSLAGCAAIKLLSLETVCDEAGYALVDLNGDALLDRVQAQGSRLRVAFNTGNGFAAEIDWNGALDDAIAASGDTSLGGGAYFTIGIGPLCLPTPECYIIINPGGDGAQSMSRQELQLLDVDGDGYPDHVSSDESGQMRVARNQIGRTNLLKQVTRPLGATIDLQYERDGNTYDQPQSSWVLSNVAMSDGHPGEGVDTQLVTMRYEGGVYNRLEREFYGYGVVTEEHRDTAHANALYRSIRREFRTDSFYTRGLLTRELTRDAAGNSFVEEEHSYELRDVASGAIVPNPAASTAAIFPALVRTDQRFYEGQAAPGKQTHVRYQYDSLGNVTELFDAGDVGAGDDTLTTTSYSQCPDTYVVGMAVKTVVSSNGTELRHSESAVDCATAKVTQTRDYLTSATAAVTDYLYFSNGNVRQVIGPANLHGQRLTRTYEYDPTVATYVTRVTDSFGYSSTATYNLKYGVTLDATDVSGNTTSYRYDAFGRLVSIIEPYEQGGPTPTIRLEYHPEAAPPWSIARHLDSARSPTDTIDTVVFIDGLGRVIQTKQDSAIHRGPDAAVQDVMVVAGGVTFDFLGRIVEQFYPLVEPLGTPGVFNTGRDSVAPTRTTYDVLDRTTSTVAPDGTHVDLSYGFGPDRAGATQFETTIVNQNGVPKKEYRDVRDLMTALKEFNNGGQQVIWTSYSYDPLRQIVQVEDDAHNLTRAAYDAFGRRTLIDSPDAGRVEFGYDLASNLTSRSTGVLRSQSKQISYDYDYDRLKTISYPNFPGNNVSYSYGAPGAADNRADRITKVVDESGAEELFYGKQGEITKEIKTVASDTGAPDIYTTQYVFETFGRLVTLTYPDGEVLTYRYDSGGRLRQAAGQKGRFSYPYINRMEYDKFGAPAFSEAGNLVRTSYSYDPLVRLLDGVTAGKRGASPFQQLAYRYDDVGNVLSAANHIATPPASQLGGPVAQAYGYDDLNRLTSAGGVYWTAPAKTRRYGLSLQYDTIHNLTGKQQRDTVEQSGGNPIEQHNTTYSYAYRYEGPQPHAASRIGDRTFSYDADGNQTGWDDTTNGTRRINVWDEEDRLQSVSDNGQETTFKYNDAGERVIKRGPQGETVYVNPFFSIRNREVGTKHVYAGAMRFASKMMKKNGSPTFEQDQYFFSDDNLGSSNYVTDAAGKIFEHLEYFASGETWVEEHSNTQRTPYLFTGKELDEETNLYYYGARYYDPQTSAWQSADPILSAYLDGNGDGGGVYDSLNINLYAYSGQNPTTFTDPDGRQKRVRYFSSPYAKRARAWRALGNVGGRNLATVEYTVLATGAVKHKTMMSWGKHSEKRLKEWLDATHGVGGYTVAWLYTELEPCGSDVHNCKAKVGAWFPGAKIRYSVRYPNSSDVNPQASNGAWRSLALRKTIAKRRRARGPTRHLKRYQTKLRQQGVGGLPFLVTPAQFKPTLPDIDSSDDEGYDL
jgi:RHS repeat-associated protein